MNTLRERVALAMAAVPRQFTYSRQEAWEKALAEADMAISVVLEEAARVAEETAVNFAQSKQAGQALGANAVKYAIRNFKEMRP